MAAALVVALRPDVRVSGTADTISFEWSGGRLLLRALTPALASALRGLAGSGQSEEALAELVAGTDGLAVLPRLYYHLHHLAGLRLLRYSVVADGRPVATLVPIAPDFHYIGRRASPGARYILSRFACCRRDQDVLLLDSPLALCQIVLHDDLAAPVLARLARPGTPEEVGAGLRAPDIVAGVLDLLLSAGMVAEVGQDGRTLEDADPALRQWEFHDLLVHSRSRKGRHDLPYGGVYRFFGQISPLPAVKAPVSGEMIALERPDLDALARSDRPFAAVLEARKSIREYGDRPLSSLQLGEFLYRVARVRAIEPEEPEAFRPYEVTSRPYPGGGACYELELYPIVNRCEGIPAGLYHYDPLAHVLRRVREKDELVEAMLGDGEWVTGAGRIQVMIVIAARFERVMWKYGAMAYALILKDVGVLYQTMYLVAAAMGLSPCALGGGDADLLTRAIGIPYHVESAVGEFLLGSRRL